MTKKSLLSSNKGTLFQGAVIHYLSITKIILLGFILRLYGLGKHDLWYDEGATAFLAEHIENISETLYPPLYFFFLHIWTKFFGNSEFSLRLPSTLFSVISIFLIYKLAKYIFNEQTGRLSALLFAIAPIHVWYAQEAGFYSMHTALIIASIYFFIKALDFRSLHLWIGYGIILLLALYTNNLFTFFIIIASCSFLFIKDYRNSIVKWSSTNLSVLCLLLPLIFYLLPQQLLTASWIPKPTLKSMLITFENFNLGYCSSNSLYICSDIVFGGLFILGIINSYRHREKRSILLMSFIFIPILLSFWISKWKSVYLDRLLLPTSAFYYIIISFGLMALNERVLKQGLILICLFLMASSLCNYYTDYMPTSPNVRHIGTFIKRPFEPMVNFVETHLRSEDIIAVTNVGLCHAFWYYGELDTITFSFFIPEAQEEYWREQHKVYIKKKGNVIELPKDITKCNFGRIWLISSSWARDYTLDENSLAVREWMVKNYRQTFERWFDGVLVELYERM